MVKIFLDAGHGGSDSGAIGNGIHEANITLKLVLKTRDYLVRNYSNAEIMLSRDSDKTISLDARTDKANAWKADVFVSIHVNSATASATGFETFIHPITGADTKSLQNVMHNEIFNQIKGGNIIDRGKKQANFHVLRESNMSAILTENLFINNSTDASKLKNDAFLNMLAKGHARGLAKFFGLKEKELATTPTKDNVLYQVITGTFQEKQNAVEQVANLKKLGYDSYIIEKDK
jgi:N-acetylmuramoyl-L-alanine amidase